MPKIFNVNADCQPELHYMVDITDRLLKIKEMIDHGQYFTINRARQYGKTTTIQALSEFLKDEYVVVSLDFQLMSEADFESEREFVTAFSREILDNVQEIPGNIEELITAYAEGTAGKISLPLLFKVLSLWCGQSEKKIVLIIDEVDNAANNQVFLDFLAQLRGYYIKRRKAPTFQSVILVSVYDIKNIRRKFRPDQEHRANSPWNTHAGNEENERWRSFDECPWYQREHTPFDIAADFLIDMSFSASDIAGMLTCYEEDYHTGMNVKEMADSIFDYSSGYPYLVSRLCKLMDERIAGTGEFPDKSSAWTKEGFLEAVKLLLGEKNTLFESLMNKLADYPELRRILNRLLFAGKSIPYNPLNKSIEEAEMFGLVKNSGGNVAISNRIFETLLYNLFLSEELVDSKEYDAGLQARNQFVSNGRLNMKRILEKFVIHFHELYGEQDETFLEDVGRRYFLLYLKPIINGSGNYYVEAETRNRERTDVVVDYHGEQYVIEMKIWRGNAYNERGERQLSSYLEYYHLKKGYMLSFCFNKNKEIGVKEILVDDKVLVEAVV